MNKINNTLFTINNDKLSVVSDDEVYNTLREARKEIRKIENLFKTSTKNNIRQIRERLRLTQIEYCYVKRENEIRQTRHQKHADYIRNTRKRPFLRSKGA